MLEDPPLLVVKKNWPRPTATQLKRLAGVQTGHAVDAMFGRGALDGAIKPIDPARAHFVGVAITAETGPSDNLAILAALSVAQPGDCLVAASEAFSSAAVVGDNVCWLARNGRLSAIVIDGMARDADGIIGVGLPTFARGITPNSCVRSGPGRVGFPVVAGGVAIASGDVVIGDRDGVVVIPQAELDVVLDRLDAIRIAEIAVQKRIASGLTQLDAMTSLMQSAQVKYVD